MSKEILLTPRIVVDFRLFSFNKLTLLTALFTLLWFTPAFLGKATLAFPCCHTITTFQFSSRSFDRNGIVKLGFIDHGKILKYIIMLP